MNKKALTRINHLISILVFPALFFLLYGLNKVDHYSNWFLYVLTLLGIGCILGLVLSSIVYNKLSYSLTKKHFKGSNIRFLSHKIWFLTVLFSFGGGCMLGEAGTTIKETKQFKIIRKGKSGSSKHRDYYLFINYRGELVRYSFGKSVYDLYEAGDQIKLSVKSNLFGFEFVEPAAWE